MPPICCSNCDLSTDGKFNARRFRGDCFGCFVETSMVSSSRVRRLAWLLVVGFLPLVLVLLRWEEEAVEEGT